MPWLHRLACFRDDVVFCILIYQVRTLLFAIISFFDPSLYCSILTISDGSTESITLESTNMVRSMKVWLSLSERAQWKERKSKRSSRRRPSRLGSGVNVVGSVEEYGLCGLVEHDTWMRACVMHHLDQMECLNQCMMPSDRYTKSPRTVRPNLIR